MLTVTTYCSVRLRRLLLRPAILAAAILWLIGLFSPVKAADGFPGLGPDACPSGSSERKGELEARAGYLWGTNQIRFRDGDNANLPPGQKEVSLESPIFGVMGQTFRSRDFSLRAKGWINLPQSSQGDWLLERTARLWESEARYLAADVSVIYYLGLGGMPYSAGLVGGYRYADFDYESFPVRAPAGNYEDHIHVHIPYVGVSYSNNDFAGTVVRLDVLVSPFTMSGMDSEQHLQGVTTQVTGQSLSGFWFESFFGWYWPMSENGRFGMFVNYNFLELSGGATVRRTGASTRFSLDSTTNMVTVGLAGAYSFWCPHHRDTEDTEKRHIMVFSVLLTLKFLSSREDFRNESADFAELRRLKIFAFVFICGHLRNLWIFSFGCGRRLRCVSVVNPDELLDFYYNFGIIQSQ